MEVADQAPQPSPAVSFVLACSATKRPDVGRIPARDRYDGPLWRSLRATDPDDRLAVSRSSRRTSSFATPAPRSRTMTLALRATSLTA